MFSSFLVHNYIKRVSVFLFPRKTRTRDPVRAPNSVGSTLSNVKSRSLRKNVLIFTYPSRARDVGVHVYVDCPERVWPRLGS